VIDFALRSVEFDDEDRLDIKRISGVDERLSRMNGELVHHLDAARNNPGADDVTDAGRRRRRGGKADQQGAGDLRSFQDSHRHLGDDAEQPFRTDDNAEQIVTGGVEMLAAKPDDLAGDQRDLTAQHVVGRHAVFEAVNAAGILRDIAADRAGDLRRRIGRIVEALVLHGLRDGEIGHARFHDRNPVGEIDLADAVEFRHARRTPSPSGSAPPDSEVPAPRGTTLMPL